MNTAQTSAVTSDLGRVVLAGGLWDVGLSWRCQVRLERVRREVFLDQWLMQRTDMKAAMAQDWTKWDAAWIECRCKGLQQFSDHQQPNHQGPYWDPQLVVESDNWNCRLSCCVIHHVFVPSVGCSKQASSPTTLYILTCAGGGNLSL